MTEAEILRYAIEEYPPGTTFKVAHVINGDTYTVKPTDHFEFECSKLVLCVYNNSKPQSSKQGWSACVYHRGKWAEITEKPMDLIKLVDDLEKKIKQLERRNAS